MKLYELTIILNPTLDDSSIQTEVDRIERQITGGGGQIEKIERWGNRRLTYRIKTQTQGYYVFFLFNAPPGLSAEIEKSMRLNENILRFLTILSPGIVAAKPIKAVIVEQGETVEEDSISEQE